MKTAIQIIVIAILAGCSSVPTSDKRVFLDSTTHSDSPPSWVRSTASVWEKDSKVQLRASQTVRGDERVNGCYDLARLDAKEKVLSEIANNVRGTIDNAQQSISESAETLLGKARSAQFDGRLQGLRFSEEYFERYRIGDVERVDCHVLAEIKQSDYDRVKRAVVEKIVEVDPRLKEAVTKKHIDFFRTPASEQAHE